MIYLISYDISSNKVRQKVSEQLIRTGFERVQKSVFLGSLNDIKMNPLRLFLQQQLGNLTTEEEAKDNVLILRLGLEQLKKIELIGNNNFDIDEISGEKSTLIF